jgi:hypothetical protein
MKRPFGGIGRIPAALLVAGGLMVGDGIGGFVIANAATTPSATATPGPSHSDTTPTMPNRHCTHMGGSASGSAAASGAAYY